MVVISVEVIVDCGGVLAAAINAAILALMDAGVPLVHTPLAVDCCLLGDNGVCVLDPSTEEESVAIAKCTLAFCSAAQDGDANAGIAAMVVEGRVDNTQMDRLISACHSAMFPLQNFIRLSRTQPSS